MGRDRPWVLLARRVAHGIDYGYGIATCAMVDGCVMLMGDRLVISPISIAAACDGLSWCV